MSAAVAAQRDDPGAAGRPASQDPFCQGMRRLAGACTILTTADAGADRGSWAGLAATAVCSVSADPPRLLVCVNRRVRAHEVIARTGALGVNVLRGDQQPLARRFAGCGACAPDEKFLEGDWRPGLTGAPLLADALVGFDCRVAETVPSSTHDIFICDVLAVRLGEEIQDPLLYFNGEFRSGPIHPAGKPAS